MAADDLIPDRPPVHPKRGPGRVLATRIKVRDAERLDAVLDAKGMPVSAYVRGLILADLAGTVPARE